ncbi:MAG: hypothetical protein WCG06_06375 [Candidatus Omnitrophota bacterium]
MKKATLLASIPYLLLITVIGLCGTWSWNSYQKIQALLTQNQSLLQRSKELGATLEKIDADNKRILEQSQKDKNNLRDSLERLKQENESLRFSIQKNEAELKNALTDKQSLEEMILNKTRQLESLQASPASASTPAAAALPMSVAPAQTAGAPQLQQSLKDKDRQIAGLKEHNQILTEKLEKLYKTTNEKITEINLAKIALEETVVQARKKISDEWNTVNLGSIEAAGSGAQSAPPKADQPNRYPKKEGKILAVNDERGFVVVDMGRVDNLTSANQLLVMRNGLLIATLTPLEVRDIMTACNIKEIQSGQKIQVNDSVLVKK